MLIFLLALAPILLILILMVGLRWGAARAGAAGYLSSLLVAGLVFGGGPALLAFAHVKALLLTLDVLLIIWAAFLLYRVADEAGAIRTIGQALPHLTADRGMQALVIGWVFASFLQGVGGFGVPVAVIAPILVGLGFSPLSAVVIPSIGHGWAVTFGSLASSFQALIAATGLPGEVLAPLSALFLGISGLAVGFMVAHAADGWPAVVRLAGPVIVLGVVMGAVQYALAVSGLWNVAAFLGSLAGLVVALPLARRFRDARAGGRRAEDILDEDILNENEPLDLGAVAVALSGYVILVAITMVVQIPALKTALSSSTLHVDFPEIQTGTPVLSSLGAPSYVTPAGPGRSIPFFRHAGAVLFYSSVAAYLIYRAAGLYRPGAAMRIASGTIQRVMSSSVSIASMVAMAVVMEHTGMTEVLATGLAQGTGQAFPAVAPWIGAIGAFMTGSNTNSNVVFGALQLRTAELLGLQVTLILAAQTAGAALASVMAPTKVVVGASTAGMAGKEGDVMRELAVYTVLLVLLISVLAVAGVLLNR